MVINVSVQYNGGFLPEIILLLTLCDSIGEFLSLQPMFPPVFDCSGEVYVQIFLKTINDSIRM